MAYISFQPKDNFKTKLYTGTGAEQTISGVGFQPNMTWIKDRDATEAHTLFDSVRGATKRFYVNTNVAESTSAISLTSWNSDGFVIGSGGEVNTNTDKFVSWNWKMATTSGLDLSAGTITPSSYAVDVAAGMGVYKFTGNAVNGATFAHGLGKAPQFVFCKNVAYSGTWSTYHIGTEATSPEDYFLVMDGTATRSDSADYWYDTKPSSTLITLGAHGSVNGSGEEIVCYAFTSIKGFSKFSNFRGNADAGDAPFVYTGFRPSMVIIKCSSATEAWNMWNDKTPGYNVSNKNLQPNDSNAEQTSSAGVKEIDILSNGFRLRGSNSELNKDNGDMIYAAWAASPFVSSNSRCGTAF